MNRPIRFFSFLLSLTIAALLLIAAVRYAAAQPTAPTVRYATAFTIQSFDTYRLLTVTRPWRGADRTFEYLFVKRGTPDPEGYPGAQRIETPVSSVASLAATHLAFLGRLGTLDRLTAIANPQYVSSETVQAGIAAGTIAAVGNGPDVDLEELLSVNPDVVTTFAMGKSTKDDYQQLLSLGMKTLIFSDYMEETPLGRAEWIKVMALLFDQEAEAERIFDDIERRYLALTEISAKLEVKPSVIMGFHQNGKWNVPGGNSVQAAYIRDAGGAYLWADDGTSGRFPISFETALEKGAEADFWLDQSLSWRSAEDILNADPRYAGIKAFADNRVYNNNRLVADNGANLYSETGIVNPDIVLADLIRILHPEALPNHDIVYYRRLDTHELP